MEPIIKIPPPVNKNKTANGGNKIVQTYAEDMVYALRNGQGGLVKRVIHGEEEHEKEKINLSPQTIKNKLFMVLGFILILLSLATLSFFLLQQKISSVSVPKPFIPIIFTDKNILVETLDIKKNQIQSNIFDEISRNSVKIGGVEGIYVTLNKNRIGLRDFINTIEASFIPGDVNIVNDNFLMGVFKDKNKDSFINSFFILLKISSIGDVFYSMKTWENKMFIDLHRFFGINLTYETKYLLTKNFENGIVENKNARILYDSKGVIIMMYVFVDDNSIVITNTENTVREIKSRLAASEVKK